jgi:hypothetical protein
VKSILTFTKKGEEKEVAAVDSNENKSLKVNYLN